MAYDNYDYIRYLEYLLNSPDPKSAFRNYFGFFTDKPQLTTLIEELLETFEKIELKDGHLVINFPEDCKLLLGAPAADVFENIPLSYAYLASVHNFIALETKNNAPIIFSGVSERGEMPVSEFFEYSTVINVNEGVEEDIELNTVYRAIKLGQDEIIFNSQIKTSEGEPALFYVNHENPRAEGPIADNLLFSEVLLILLAEKILKKELLKSFTNQDQSGVMIGSEYFQPDIEEIYVHGEDLGDITPEIGSFKNLKRLCFSRCSIKSFPAEIWNLSELEELELIACDLDSLPSEILQLKNLTTLDLAENQFAKIPEAVFQLSALKKLILSDNPLVHLPDKFESLHQLEELRISGEKLLKLPDSITRLYNLKELWVKNTGIMTLPGKIGDLKALSSLFLIENKMLEGLPDSAGNLTELEDLNINQCPSFKHIPTTIGNLEKLTFLSFLNTKIDDASFRNICQVRNLTALYITEASITNIPAEIENLPGLEKLTLEGNPITEIASEIGALKNLTTLDLDRCILTHIPEEIGKLNKLDHLILSAEGVQELPKSLAEIPELDFLCLRGFSFEEVPPFLFMLPKLRILCLKNCINLKIIGAEIAMSQTLKSLWMMDCENLISISSKVKDVKKLRSVIIRNSAETDHILETICSNPNINELEISNSGLKAIPDNISNLSVLPELDLSDNQIEKIPESIHKMKNLWLLNLQGNNISEIIPEVFEIEGLHTLDLSCNPIRKFPEHIDGTSNLKKMILRDCKQLSEEEFKKVKTLLPDCVIER